MSLLAAGVSLLSPLCLHVETLSFLLSLRRLSGWGICLPCLRQLEGLGEMIVCSCTRLMYSRHLELPVAVECVSSARKVTMNQIFSDVRKPLPSSDPSRCVGDNGDSAEL